MWLAEESAALGVCVFMNLFVCFKYSMCVCVCAGDSSLLYTLHVWVCVCVYSVYTGVCGASHL